MTQGRRRGRGHPGAGLRHFPRAGGRRRRGGQAATVLLGCAANSRLPASPLGESGQLDLETLIAHCRQPLAAFKMAEAPVLRPRNPSGKVLERILRHQAPPGLEAA